MAIQEIDALTRRFGKQTAIKALTLEREAGSYPAAGHWLADPAKKGADIVHEQLGLLQGRKVAAARHLGPMR
jgi:hypothetical protein